MLETGILAWHYFGVLKDRAEAEARQFTRVTDFFEPLEPKIEILNAEEHAFALREAKEAELGTHTPKATLGQSFVHDSSDSTSLSKLSRYEAAIERSLYRSLHELRDCQRSRKDEEAESSKGR